MDITTANRLYELRNNTDIRKTSLRTSSTYQDKQYPNGKDPFPLVKDIVG